MTTARDIIVDAMREIGAISLNDSPSSTEYQSALRVMRRMLSSWSNDSLNCYYRVRESFLLNSSKADFTIGPNETGLPDDESGIDIITARPIQIISAQIRLPGSENLDYNLSITSEVNYLNQISMKDIAGIPALLVYDNNFPVAKLSIYPVPQVGTRLFLLSEKDFSPVENLDSQISLPPGWELAIVKNLGINLANSYGQSVSQELYATAQKALGSIKGAVAANRKLEWSARTSQNNIYGGWTQ